MSCEYKCSLSPEAKEHALTFLNEEEDNRDDEIEKMQQWLQLHSHLNARSDAVSIVRFLRGCKFNEDRARKKMTNYYVMRRKVPEWFSERDPRLPQMLEMLKLGVFLPLRDADDEGRRVLLIRAAVHNPKFHLQSDFFKMCMMIMDIALEEDEEISVFGVVAVIDLSGISLSHSLALTPPVISKAMHALQDCYPVRTRSLEFFNAPSYVNIVLNVFRRFMTEKMRSRLHVHGKSHSSLHKVVPAKILPTEYGGTRGNVQDLVDHWKKRVEDRREWLLEDEKHTADSNP